MTSTTPLRTVILAAIDPTPASAQVVHTATSMARIVPGAELHFVHVIDPGPPPHTAALSMTDLVDDGRKYLDGVLATTADLAPGVVSAHLALGNPAERILQIASDLAASLIIVGTHEKGAIARILGSVSQKVILHAGVPVLLARVPKEGHAAAGPTIEPPCPDCVAAQMASRGDNLWCARHSTRHVHGHLHYATPGGYGGGSMFVWAD